MSHVQRVAQTIIHAILRLAADAHPAARSRSTRYPPPQIAPQHGQNPRGKRSVSSKRTHAKEPQA
jgi:hypothetical protein